MFLYGTDILSIEWDKQVHEWEKERLMLRGSSGDQNTAALHVLVQVMEFMDEIFTDISEASLEIQIADLLNWCEQEIRRNPVISDYSRGYVSRLHKCIEEIRGVQNRTIGG